MRGPSTVGLDPRLSVVVDVEELEHELDEVERRLRAEPRAVGIDELMAVVDRYQGDLLAGHYDEWIDDKRKKVRGRWLAAASGCWSARTGPPPITMPPCATPRRWWRPSRCRRSGTAR